MIIQPTDEALLQVAQALQSGQVVAFPTETVYGLGANALNQSAVQQIFHLKGRPASNPLIVHVASPDQAANVADLSGKSQIKARMDRLFPFWPGPLTLVLPKHSQISSLVTAGGETVAVRIPSHPVALRLLELVKLPIAAPSANLSFGVSATTAAHVYRDFGDSIPLILDGGACTIGLESTVVNLCEAKVAILRPGAVTRAELEAVLGEQVYVPESTTLNLKDAESHATSPGLHHLHYAPRTPLQLLSQVHFPSGSARGDSKLQRGLISFSNECTVLNREHFQVITTISQTADLVEIGANLFAALRELDQQGLDLIAVDSCADKGLGRAIMDRVRRARHN